MQAQQILQGVYETVYGIFNHVANQQNPSKTRRPFASVAFHPSEDFTTNSLLKQSMELFRDLPIKEIFNCTYFEFMKQSTDICDLMIQVAREHREKESKHATDAEKALAKATKEKQMMDASLLAAKKTRF